MGQEKSVPIRCNTCHKFSSSIKTPGSLSTSTINLKSESVSNLHQIAPSPSSRSPSRNTNKSTKSSQSAKTTLHSTHTRLVSRHSTVATNSSASSSTSYKNIVEEDRTTTARLQPVRNGIRNYTPKILSDQRTPESTSASSTSSNEPEDIDIWI